MNNSEIANEGSSSSPASPAPKIQVIARAAKILRSLEDHPDGLSLAQIAARVGLARSTVQRIVTALAEEQFLISASPRSRVKLGPELIRLASATSIEIRPIVKPYMNTLGRELEETIDLSMIQGKSAVFIEQVPSNHRLRAVSAIGERFPLHCTANGKALLAALDDVKLKKMLNVDLEAYTPNTIIDPVDILKEIEEIRKTNVAFDNEELTEGICAIGTSFQDPTGRPYAMSIPVPKTRFLLNKARVQEALLDCRDQIVSAFGKNKFD